MGSVIGVSYRPVSLGGSQSASITVRDDQSMLLRSTEALLPYPRKLTECLVHWARVAPHRTFAAKRDAAGEWRRLTYVDMLRRVRSIAQALTARPLSTQRPVVVLSGNDLEHLQLSLGAMWAGIPICPVSPSYSLLSTDYARLRHVFGVVTPGLVFCSRSDGFAAAIKSVVPLDTELVLTQGTLEGRAITPFSSLADTVAGAAADAAHDAVTPDTIAKFLFTSGSTTQPKAVITTQRMLCANQQMILQCLRCLGEDSPILVDWLPWNHTFGGSHNVGIALYNGGTLYIDDGRPTTQHFSETLRNLREIAPTVYFNVPKAWEDLTAALEKDAVLRTSFFSKVKLFFYAGASLSQDVWDRLDRVAESTIGARIKMITGLGMTETAPSSLFATGNEVRAGYVGLPAPGCDVTLVPNGSKLEARFRGPHVMPGYWRDADKTRDAFDADGFYRTGDALRLVDPDKPDLGLAFDGRVTEDFKLATGGFVSVGPLIQKILAAAAPYVLDVVVTGANRNEIGILIFPRMDTCRELAQSNADAPRIAVLSAPPVRKFFQSLIDSLAAYSTGSSNRIARALLLTAPPSFANGEITDKGSINQRAVLACRSALIEAMYDGSNAELIRPAIEQESNA